MKNSMAINHSPIVAGFLKTNGMFGSSPKAAECGHQASTSSPITLHSVTCTLSLLISLLSEPM